MPKNTTRGTLILSSLTFMLSASDCALEQDGSSAMDAVDAEAAALSLSTTTGYWTGWMNRDNPGGAGDYEIDFPNPCGGSVPGNVIVQTTGGAPYQNTREFVHADPTRGGWCVNAEQPDGICNYDYRVKFYCDPRGSWTSWMNRDTPGGNGDYEIGFPNPCNGMIPMNAVVETTGGTRLEYTGESVYVDPSQGGWCLNAEQPDGICNDYRVKFYCAGGGAWTDWMDKDDPSGAGDYETGFPSVCSGAAPTNVNAQTTGGIPYQNTGEFVHADPSPNLGAWCVNSEQSDGSCNYDYRVKFYCP